MDDSNGTLAYIQSKSRIKRKQYNPVCPYCGIRTKLVNGTTIYPHRYDLRHKQFYLCKDCDAYCECHGSTTCPLGTPANADLRETRLDAHNAFDPLWKEEHYIPHSATTNTKGDLMTRNAAYIFLAADMHLAMERTHIGKFNLIQCRQVKNFVKKYYEQCKHHTS